MKTKVFMYSCLIYPNAKKPEDYNCEEAQAFFDWYIKNIPERINYLSDFSGINLDYSEDSLKHIWKWFLKNAIIEKTPKPVIKQLRKDLNKFPKSFIDYVINEEKTRFSLESCGIINDIGMYLGEVFIRNCVGIRWGYHTQDYNKDSFINTPELQGFEDKDYSPPFKMNFDVEHMVSVQASKMFDGTQSDLDLFNIYMLWKNKYIN